LAVAAQMGETLSGASDELSQGARSWISAQLGPLWKECVSLPIAALLGAILAFRPQRSGTPMRKRVVIHTQILLAIIGALIMLVVGSSLARAFGIVGAASLVRYRAKISDPKDAGVMLGALSIGFASGVGLHLVAAFATGFMLLVLWLIESLGPDPMRVLELTFSTAESPARLRSEIERIFSRERIEYQLRGTTDGHTCYEVRIPYTTSADDLAHSLLPLEKLSETSFRWEEKKSSSEPTA
jgi:uncharacterized membrane protein YhiD involved in acid resistance